jgi:hypothetical protein
MTAATVKLKSCIIVPFVAIATTLNHRLRAGRARTRSVHKKITRCQLALRTPFSSSSMENNPEIGGVGAMLTYVRTKTRPHTHTCTDLGPAGLDTVDLDL